MIYEIGDTAKRVIKRVRTARQLSVLRLNRIRYIMELNN